MRSTYKFLVIGSALVIALVVAGCSDDPPTGSFEPQIVNNPDYFSYRVSNVYMVTSELTYTWSNSGNQANIYHASGRSHGTGTLELLDADGTQVYHSALLSSTTEASASGTPGQWTVVVLFNEFSGTVNFRLEKL